MRAWLFAVAQAGGKGGTMGQTGGFSCNLQSRKEGFGTAGIQESRDSGLEG